MRSLLPHSSRTPRPSSDGSLIGDRHVMSAAAVVFSFGHLEKKLGKPLSFLHAPVPGFQQDLNDLVNRTFDSLQPKRPLWRSNWFLVENGDLDDPSHHSYSTPEAAAKLTAQPSCQVAPESRWLKVEYQTLMRLPRTQSILFTIRTYVEPITELNKAPHAAASLSRSIKTMGQSMRAYKGLVQPEVQERMIEYLDSIAAGQQCGT